jgi:hypothetical protein
VLIEQELSEDSSDEEYQPNDEEQEQVLVLLQNIFTHVCFMHLSYSEVNQRTCSSAEHMYAGDALDLNLGGAWFKSHLEH